MDNAYRYSDAKIGNAERRLASRSRRLHFVFANGGKITFSSTNNGNGVFWANPNVEFLSEDWWILLNDKDDKNLYVLFIPGNSINADELLVRADKPKQIDLQIKNDGSFIDSRSKYSFKEYLKTTIKY